MLVIALQDPAILPSIVALISALIAAGVSIFVAVSTRKAQRDLATSQADLDREINSFNDALERNREFAGFGRERIVGHLDHVIEAYIDLYALAQTVILEAWLDSNDDLATQIQFRLALSRLRAHYGSLESMEILPDDLKKAFLDVDWRVLEAWKSLLGEGARRQPEFREKHPQSEEQFSTKKYFELWQALVAEIEKMGVIVKSLSKRINLPQ